MPSRKRPGKRQSPPAPAAGGRLQRRWGLAAIAVLLLALAGFWNWPSEVAATAAPQPAAAAADIRPRNGFPPNRPQPDLMPVTHEQRLVELREQGKLVEHTLCAYREATKYPNNSRPISEHPDQVYPNQLVQDRHAMRKDGGGADPAVQISTTQSRVYLASGETARFTLKAEDKDGRPLPLYVTRAAARGLTYQGSRDAPQVILTFADDGNNNGTVGGNLAPGISSLAGFNGTIRTEVKYQVGDRAGVVLFDVIYSPEIPATWSGPIRESSEGGSLNFHLPLNVNMPGRYIVTGRVDDGKGQPFALVNFNDLLLQGPNEVRLTVFGKLLRDQKPSLPLTLRDVDAYLLKENADPDRVLMPRLTGSAHVSKSYPLKSFSDAEWQSEERSRHLTEYGKDVELARKALVEFNPELAQKDLPSSDCGRTISAQLK